MISPEEKENKWELWLIWSLLTLSVLVALRIKMASEASESLITLKEVIAGFIGVAFTILVQVIWHFIKVRYFEPYPQKLFKTHFHSSHPYDKKNIGKPLLLHVGQTYRGFFYVETKRSCEGIERVGVRPQVNKIWYKRWFCSYNEQTDNLSVKDRYTPPIKVISIKDSHSAHEKYFSHDASDNLCGRWGFYQPKITVNPSTQLIYDIELQALKVWDGFIDFR